MVAHGLVARADLNEKTGVVTAWDGAKQRYTVFFDEISQPLAIKAANLTDVGLPAGPAAGPAAGPGPSAASADAAAAHASATAANAAAAAAAATAQQAAARAAAAVAPPPAGGAAAAVAPAAGNNVQMSCVIPEGKRAATSSRWCCRRATRCQ